MPHSTRNIVEFRNPYHDASGRLTTPRRDVGQRGRVYALRRVDTLRDVPGGKCPPFDLAADPDPHADCDEQLCDVPIASLMATRGVVSPDLTKGYVDRANPRLPDGAPRGKGPAKAPVVKAHGDRHLIEDGHHRATAAWARGDKTIQVYRRTPKTATSLTYRNRLAMLLAEFDESLHPRDEAGRFVDSGGDGGRIPSVKVDAAVRSTALSKFEAGDVRGAVESAGDAFKTSLTTLSEKIPAAHDELQRTLSAVVADVGGVIGDRHGLADAPGVIGAMGPPKSEKRLVEKALREYEGDLSMVKDAVRATIAVDSLDDVDKVVSAIKSRAKIAREKNRIKEPTNVGYRDIMLNVEMPNGITAEVQVNLKPMLKAKSGLGHKLYEQARSLVNDHSESAKRTLASLTLQSIALYSSAWAAVEAASKMGGKS